MGFASFWDKVEPYFNTINYAIIALVSVYYTVFEFFLLRNIGATNFSLHVWLSGIGYHLLMTEAIIGIYQGNSWSRQHSRRSRFNIHCIMQAVGSTLSVSGLLVQSFAYGKHHMNNYHSFLGLISIFFMMGAFLNGTIALWAPEIRKWIKPVFSRWIKPVFSRWFHNVIGIIAFAMGMVSISHGYDLRDFSRLSTVPIMYALKWAAYITAVLSLIGADARCYRSRKGFIVYINIRAAIENLNE